MTQPLLIYLLNDDFLNSPAAADAAQAKREQVAKAREEKAAKEKEAADKAAKQKAKADKAAEKDGNPLAGLKKK